MQKLKILIVGGGGREHAVGWKVAQSPRCGELYFAPGNAGTAELGTNVDIKATDIPALLDFAKKEGIDLTLALPDDPLSLGIVDQFRAAGLRVFGPTKAAAQLEWSKAFSKHFMERHNLPTAKFATFTSYDEAVAYVEKMGAPMVVKASGLALGKGVAVCMTAQEAEDFLENIFIKRIFGDGGNEVVIEEFLTGPEISIHAFSDGISYKVFPSSQDHKRIGEGNTGPNTGGMGTIAPLPFVTAELMKTIEDTIISPTLSGTKEDGAVFEGILFPGLMLTPDGPKIIEYNSRFGDPETQSYMRLLDTDILDIFDAIIDHNLAGVEIKWKNLFACTIVLASGGYPDKYEKGKVITGVDSPLEEYPLAGEVDAFSTPSGVPATPQEGNGVIIFHAGTTRNDAGELVTNGGRVFGVTATGATLDEALASAYKAVEGISFEGMQYRRDIGKNI